MNNEKTLLLVEAATEPQREKAFQEYMSNAGPITKGHGGEVLNKYSVDALEHETDIQVAVLYRFPERAAILALFDDAEYKKLIPVRDAAFSEIRYTILEQQE